MGKIVMGIAFVIVAAAVGTVVITKKILDTMAMR
jgi:hypothetical protein